ncbi:hypothetical protein SCP_1702280 [Sparassis crispa]|uniref:Protein-S-isoprenylcysteine O-methyltransferase n=1 Tax=Sparassis crispa TaxID=139825 RepID=A0A401H672_9APHY|nr:hypothetical protein SCP_1702280 [Sparassis crispa]GBE89902.1 hypothetical protein SCP_1702280 [Sparassis crispa]
MVIIIKVALLLLAALFHNIDLMPPQPPLGVGGKVYKGQLFERAVLLWVYGTWAMITALAFSNSGVLFALHYAYPYSSHILSNLCPARSPSLDTIGTLTPPFLFGFSLMILATLLRVWCFVTLGPLFTYEVTIKHGHRLITSGPYSYVRHPSYSAVFLMLLGAVATFCSHGNYITEWWDHGISS